ncbi:hypothetical protein ABB02_00931 [Clostridiaceae bacterium JG1575]|nr:hypothetical protein ABB02_00931 [Clostridiaceae bacterium JG1575]
MTLHLGDDVTAHLCSIIGIFNMDPRTLTSDNIAFLKTSEEEGFIERISAEPPKSFVVAQSDHHTTIYLSPISTKTLIRRADPAHLQEEDTHVR